MTKIFTAIEFYFAIIFCVIGICAIESMSIPVIFAFVVITACLVYSLYNRFSALSDDEFSKVTGYCFFEKWLGPISE